MAIPTLKWGRKWGRGMPRTLEKLSAVAVSKATKPGRLSDGGGLYLNVTP